MMIVGKMIDGLAHLSPIVDLESRPQPDDVIFEGGLYYRMIGGAHVQRVQLSDDDIVEPSWPDGFWGEGVLWMLWAVMAHSLTREGAAHE